jgi:predicted dehydrogenase
VCAPFTWLSPTFQTIWRRIHAGEIGRVVSARGRYGWAGPDWSEWFFKAGGGSIFDLGVYNLTTLVGLLGPVKRVSAMCGVAVPERDIRGVRLPVESEDNAHVLLDFGAARFAVVTSGFTIQQYRGPGLELYGTTGTIQMLGDDWNPDGYELWQNDAGCWRVFKETQPDWPWTDGLRHLVECVRAGVRPLIRPEHAYHVLEVMLAAHTASREGRVVAVKSTFEPPEFGKGEAARAVHRIHDRTRGE